MSRGRVVLSRSRIAVQQMDVCQQAGVRGPGWLQGSVLASRGGDALQEVFGWIRVPRLGKVKFTLISGGMQCKAAQQSPTGTGKTLFLCHLSQGQAAVFQFVFTNTNGWQCTKRKQASNWTIHASKTLHCICEYFSWIKRNKPHKTDISCVIQGVVWGHSNVRKLIFCIQDKLSCPQERRAANYCGTTLMKRKKIIPHFYFTV